MNLSSDKSPHVPGQYLGYSLQADRLLALLLSTGPGTTVSLEVFEDVGMEDATGAKTAVQTKSALASNPVGDRSDKLWKAFANWMNACETSELDSETTKFVIFVTAPKQAPIAESFSGARDENEALGLVADAERQLLSKDAAEPLPASVRKYADPVFDARRRGLLSKIVKNFSLQFGSGSTRRDLTDMLKAKFVGEEIVDVVLTHAIGWVKEATDSLLEKQEPAILEYDKFHREMVAFLRKYSFQSMLVDFAGDPPVGDIGAGLFRIYVQQLQLVQCEEEEKIKAVRSFLRASANIVEWSTRTLVHASSIKEFEKALREYWHNTKKQQDLDHSTDKPELRGQRLLYACLEKRMRLQGLDVPDDFTPGSYHSLADELEVGWHPEYKKLLKRNRKK